MIRRILFLCVANSARSQMAEGLARTMLPPEVEVASAGSTPGHLNPMAVDALSEMGIDISGHRAKPLSDVSPEAADLIVTLCAAEVRPIAPGTVKRLHWPIADPQDAGGFRTARDQIKGRIEVLAALLNLPKGPAGVEFHASIRVRDLADSARFYGWLLNSWPREWTHRYATFIRPDLGLNLVLMVADDTVLHHDTLYHLGLAVADKATVIDTYHSAVAFGAHVQKPPRTTWKGTPLHELWLTDPDGTLIEIYARLTDAELAAMPADQAPEYLAPGTGASSAA